MTLVLNEMRMRMAVRFVNAEWQERPVLMSDDRLMMAAQLHAIDMAIIEYFDHVNRGGYWPNWRVKARSYYLPYKDKANNVEGIGRGWPTPEEFMVALYASPDHKPHVTGNASFFFRHIYFGVGHYVSVHDVPYYVLITAPPEPDKHNIYIPVASK